MCRVSVNAVFVSQPKRYYSLVPICDAFQSVCAVGVNTKYEVRVLLTETHNTDI